jgi:hypothetical protein
MVMGSDRQRLVRVYWTMSAEARWMNRHGLRDLVSTRVMQRSFGILSNW